MLTAILVGLTVIFIGLAFKIFTTVDLLLFLRFTAILIVILLVIDFLIELWRDF